jgi:hypothetical protein
MAYWYYIQYAIQNMRSSFFAFVTASAALMPLSVSAYDLPDPKITPGAINERVTQANIHGTIGKKGWTRTIRPPVSYTTV